MDCVTCALPIDKTEKHIVYRMNVEQNMPFLLFNTTHYTTIQAAQHVLCMDSDSPYLKEAGLR